MFIYYPQNVTLNDSVLSTYYNEIEIPTAWCHIVTQSYSEYCNIPFLKFNKQFFPSLLASLSVRLPCFLFFFCVLCFLPKQSTRESKVIIDIIDRHKHQHVFLLSFDGSSFSLFLRFSSKYALCCWLPDATYISARVQRAFKELLNNRQLLFLFPRAGFECSIMKFCRTNNYIMCRRSIHNNNNLFMNMTLMKTIWRVPA